MKNFVRRSVILSLFGLVVGLNSNPLAGSAIASNTMQYQVSGRLLTVTASGESQAPANRAYVRLLVKSDDKDVAAAFKEVDEQTKRILSFLSDNKIDSKDVQKVEIHVDTQRGGYSVYAKKMASFGGSDGKAPDIYNVQRVIVFTVRDLNALQTILVGVIQSGASVVEQVHLVPSDLSKLKDEARANALRAARAKAESMLPQVGAKLGRAMIVEDHSTDVRGLELGINVDEIESVGSGSIVVTSTVGVTYEMTD